MYTEIRTNLTVSDRAVRLVLLWMCEGRTGQPPFFPEHPFFSCSRWEVLFTMGSFYFDENYRRFSGDDKKLRIETCSNLKNYDGEIGKFVDWVRPYCSPQDGPIVTEEYETDGGKVKRYYQDGRVDYFEVSHS